MLFSNIELERINRAVAQAEAKTAAEIVPVVAAASGRYDRPEDVVGLWLGAIAMAALFLFAPRIVSEPGSWAEPSTLVGALALILALVVGFLVGAMVASRVGWLRRLFTPRRQMKEEVAARARVAFYDRRLHHTSESTGILLYVSLYERLAYVLADQAVHDHLGKGGIDLLTDHLNERLRQHGPIEALCQTIAECGDLLNLVLPRRTGASNQLPNALVLLD